MSNSYEREIVVLLEHAVLSNADKEEVLERLALMVNHLIVHDFGKLVRILYRVDVDEYKLKNLLNENPRADAGVLIANMLVERQEQKERFRKMFSGTGSRDWGEDL